MKNRELLLNSVLSVWYYFLFLALVVFHCFLCIYYKEMCIIVTPIISKATQVLGSCLTVMVINENTGKLKIKSIMIKMNNMLFSLGIIHKQASLYSDMKIISPKINFEPILKRRYTDLNILAEDMHKELDNLRDQISGLEAKFDEELGVDKNDKTTFLQRITKSVSSRLSGNFMLEIFGLLMLIYGIIIS